MMKAIFYNKMIVLLCLGMLAPINAMQPAKPEQTSLSNLPKELQEMITLKTVEIKPSQELLDKITTAIESGSSNEEVAKQLVELSNQIGDIIQGIKSLGMVNKRLYSIINNPKNTDYFIRTIARNWAQDILSIAIALGTPGAKQWIQEFIKTPEGLEKARNLLFASASGGPLPDEVRKGFIYALKQVGFDINTPDEVSGATALFFAAREGNKDMVKYLLKHGANKNHLDNTGKKALNYIPHHPRTSEALDLAELLE